MNASETKFPTPWAVKVFGRAQPGFPERVLAIVQRHAPEVAAGALTTRPSRQGGYVAVTIQFQAKSRAQLEAIYRDLDADETVSYLL